MRLCLITAIPQTVHGGSGCYVGIETLASGFAALGNQVEMVLPVSKYGSFLADRYFFNQSLRWRRDWNYDAIIGFDLDGFAIPQPRNAPHVANIKGVLGDAVRFESGSTRASMALQAKWERDHARRADVVITISDYCKSKLQELYGVRSPITVIPEGIDLDTWRRLFAANPFTKDEEEFTVLCVCRLYPRKRVALLLHAADQLRRISGLRIRIVGGGPEAGPLMRLTHELKLEKVVTWVGEASRDELAREYNRADIFCLPSVQEGFGIVFLEAMAAGKPIVATRVAAVPEVVKHGFLVDPENVEALADGIWRMWRNPCLREQICLQQRQDVEGYDMVDVSRRFLHATRQIAMNTPQASTADA